jgi:hypothetical protein
MKQRTLKVLNGIIEDAEVDLEQSDREFANMIRPKQLTGKYSYEIKYDQGFEQNCIMLGKLINQPVKTLTTKEYFTLIGYYNTQNKR